MVVINWDQAQDVPCALGHQLGGGGAAVPFAAFLTLDAIL